MQRFIVTAKSQPLPSLVFLALSPSFPSSCLLPDITIMKYFIAYR